MDDLISRAAAIARIDKCIALSGIGLEPVMAVRDIKALISVLPAVDAAPVVHSSWHWTQDGYVYCENCTFPLAKTKVNIDGVERYLYLTTNYCAHCGAKMDGDTE